MNILKHTQPYCVVVQMLYKYAPSFPCDNACLVYSANSRTYFSTFYVERFTSLSKPK